MEGCVETSRPGLDGQRVPRSLDDVRAGRAQFVTLASDPSNYGKYFNLGTITYTSALDKQKHTVQNVIGYVHDTGGAFRGKPQKLDVNTTICNNCTDAQASALASGRNVSFIPSNQGLVDTAGGNNSGYGNVLTGNPQDGAGTAPTGVQSGSPQGAQQSSPSTPNIKQTPSNPFTQETAVKDPAKIPFEKETNKERVVADSADKMKLACALQKIQWSCSSDATHAIARSQPQDRLFIGALTSKGEKSVRPRQKTLYTVECFKEKKKLEFASCALQKGTTIASASAQSRPLLSLEVSPIRIKRGGHVHITWSARRVRQCNVTGQGISERGPVGSVDTESLLTRGISKIYLTCKGNDGTEVVVARSIRVE